MGESAAGPNRVQDDWFREHLGKTITAFSQHDEITGALIRWDHYSLTLRVGGGAQLLLKAHFGRFRGEEKGDRNG
ncbi:MAG: hypothetical protein MUC88_00450 [Planctomycetes bacterium]|jgi:hypothetical protein|nr:hypothetical protein [Planctomycetota bacterium]